MGNRYKYRIAIDEETMEGFKRYKSYLEQKVDGYQGRHINYNEMIRRMMILLEI